MIDIFSHSEPGGHERNEDFLRVGRHPDDKDCVVCALADGQGGQSGGARAARLACEVCADLCCEVASGELLQPAAWPALLRRVDQAVADDPDAGFTTLVAFCVNRGQVVGASSGDSAALMIDAENDGVRLTSRQAKNPPVGSTAAEFVVFSEKLAAPWKVLAMSDGVWKYASWEALREVAREFSGTECLDALRGKAFSRAGRLQDDFSVVLLEGT
jgi:serine/threonine protein phosphatase PrpC